MNIEKPLEILKNTKSFPLMHVLLVDDKIENLYSLQTLLDEGTSFNVNYILCKSGEEALKNALKEDVALILLDVQMPVMNGYEVANFLKNNSRTNSIPIVFVTAIDQDNDYVLEGFEAGAIDYLFKPLNPAITKAKVNALLQIHIHKKALEKKNFQLEEKQFQLEEALKETEKAKEELNRINIELESRVKNRTKELEESKEKISLANTELTSRNQQLKKVNMDLDNFIYTASHDLKAPISNIEGLIQTLKDELPDVKENLHILFEMVEQSIARFKNTIQQLTDIVKIQNEVVLEQPKVKIKDITLEVIEDIKDLIDKSNATVKEEIEVGEINFSKKNLRSILYNLISNGIKYSSPDRSPEILIRTYSDERHIVLSVRDNGLGIKEENFSKVFQMFKRLNTQVEGSGIGMYMVKRMIENMGGKIEVFSELGKGSEFLVYFPKEEVR